MIQDGLQNGIVVKTKDGVFKLLKNGQLQDLTNKIVTSTKEVVTLKSEPTVVPNTTPAERRATANFYFAVDDEKEIRDLRDDETEDKNKKIREFIDRAVEGIIRVALDAGVISVSGQDELVRKIIFSRLKDIRTLAEAKEALASPLIMRNKPLGKREIEILLTLVEKQRVKVEEVIRTGIIETVPVRQEARPEPMEVKPKITAVVPPAEEDKEKMGVQYGDGAGGEQYYRHIITGPVEELKNLNLKDFRKLGANPREAAGRIWQKINLLEDESLLKKDEGVKAWRQSEVGRLYLIIGATSMAEKKPVEQVIAERKARGEAFLLPEEFNAVADLNSKLIY